MRLEIRLVEIESFHLVEPGEVAIEHDLLAADEINAPFDAFHWNRQQAGGGTG